MVDRHQIASRRNAEETVNAPVVCFAHAWRRSRARWRVVAAQQEQPDMVADHWATVFINHTPGHDGASNQLDRDIIDRFARSDDDSPVGARVRRLIGENENISVRPDLISARRQARDFESPFGVSLDREWSRNSRATISVQNHNDAGRRLASDRDTPPDGSRAGIAVTLLRPRGRERQ